jgi:hypothetical protein
MIFPVWHNNNASGNYSKWLISLQNYNKIHSVRARK